MAFLKIASNLNSKYSICNSENPLESVYYIYQCCAHERKHELVVSKVVCASMKLSAGFGFRVCSGIAGLGTTTLG
jgi:hypothetical protein